MENKVLKPKIRFKGFTDTWEQRKLEGIYKFQYGEFNNNPSNGGIYPVYGANGIIGGYTNYNAENSVIIGHMGEYAGSVLWGNGKHFVTYNGTISKPRGENVVSKFGYYMLYQKDINKICGGSGLPFLSYEQLNKIEVCYPKDIKEQKSIANYLTNIDNLITLHQSKYDKLVNVKKALLEKMFPKDGKNVPEIRFKGFTDTWEQRKFKDYGSVAMCKRIFKYETSDSGDIPFYKIGTFGNKADAFITNEKYEYYKSKFSFPNKGDILLSASGTIGRIVEYSGEKAYFQDSNIVWLNHNDNIKNSFLKVLYPIVKWDGIEGSTIKRLYNSNFLSTEIHVPKVKEQEKIGVLFEKIDNLITLHQHKLEKLKNMKKSLLNKMFI